MKVNNAFANFAQFALSTQEVAMVKGGEGASSGLTTGYEGSGDDLGGGGDLEQKSVCVSWTFKNGATQKHQYHNLYEAYQSIDAYNATTAGTNNPVVGGQEVPC